MNLEQRFSVAQPAAVVWPALCDARFVAECLPGASITDELGAGRYKGKFAVRLGPIAAAFDGELAVAPQPDGRTAIVTGKGADARTSSRVTATMRYTLSESSVGATDVSVSSDIQLAGSLAQFSKGAIMQEVANRITAEFVRAFEAKLAARAPAESAVARPAPAARQASLGLGAMLWSMLRGRLARWFGGRAPGSR